MQLPIATYSSDDLLRAALRCRMDLAGAIAEPFSADGVFAFISSEWPKLAGANCVELTQPLATGQVERIEAEFASRGGRCVRWVSPYREEALLARGAALREITVLRLTNWSAAEAGDAMILQARGAPAKIELLLRSRGISDDAVQAAMQQVDNPHDEWLIGLQKGVAVAAAALLTSGDAGLLHDIYVESAEAERLVDAVAHRLIDYASRAGLKHVLACGDADELPRLETIGFKRIGMILEYTFND